MIPEADWPHPVPELPRNCVPPHVLAAALAPLAGVPVTHSDGYLRGTTNPHPAATQPPAVPTDDAQVVMLATMIGESGWWQVDRPNADWPDGFEVWPDVNRRGDVHIVDDTYGPSLGLGQVRSVWSQYGTGRERDATRLREVDFNVAACRSILGYPNGMQAWSIFCNQVYRRFLPVARAAVKESAVSRLVIQSGHYGRTSGATGGPGEAKLAYRIAQAAKTLVDAVDGWTATIIPADADVDGTDPYRRYRGDAFIALHADASGSSSVRGSSVGYRSDPEARALAHAWHAEWRRRVGTNVGPARSDNYTSALSGYYGTRRAAAVGNTRACIVEHGFMTNPDERAYLESPEAVAHAAAAVCVAVTGKAPTVTTTTNGDPMLRIKHDDRGVDVAAMQRMIRTIDNTLLPRFGADGHWGDETSRDLGKVLHGSKARQAPERYRIDEMNEWAWELLLDRFAFTRAQAAIGRLVPRMIADAVEAADLGGTTFDRASLIAELDKRYVEHGETVEVS